MNCIACLEDLGSMEVAANIHDGLTPIVSSECDMLEKCHANMLTDEHMMFFRVI